MYVPSHGYVHGQTCALVYVPVCMELRGHTLDCDQSTIKSGVCVRREVSASAVVE